MVGAIGDENLAGGRVDGDAAGAALRGGADRRRPVADEIRLAETTRSAEAKVGICAETVRLARATTTAAAVKMERGVVIIGISATVSAGRIIA